MASRQQKRRSKTPARHGSKSRFEKAVRAYQSGHLMKAKEGLKKLLKQTPEHLEGLVLLARIYAQQGDYDRSLNRLKNAISLAPDHAELRVNLAEVAHQAGQRQIALDALQRAHELDPTHLKALDGLSSLLFAEAKEQKSVELWTYGRIFLERLCALDHTNVRKRWLLADCYEREGEADKRERILREIIALDPNDVTAPFLLSAATDDERQSGEPEYARHVFDAAADTYDNHLVDALQYRVPQHIAACLNRMFGAESSLGRVLDLGCGTGLVGDALDGRCQTLLGIDISAAMIEQAKIKGQYSDLRVEEIHESLSKMNDRFDVIIAADVLSYIGAVETLMTHVHRLMAPGGHFILTVEKTLEPGFALRPSGRFAHSRDYMDAHIEAAGFTLKSYTDVVLRTEAGIDVDGAVFVMRAQHHSADAP